MTEKKPLSVRSGLVGRPMQHQPVPSVVSPPYLEHEEFDNR